jgi:hypothetical protein
VLPWIGAAVSLWIVTEANREEADLGRSLARRGRRVGDAQHYAVRNPRPSTGPSAGSP